MSKIATDLLRIASITFIMFNHAGWWYYNEVGTNYQRGLSHLVAFINQFGKPSVLFFIFLSGYAFGLHRLNQNFSSLRFYLHRFLRIWIPYTLVSFYYYMEHSAFFSLSEFFTGLITGGHKYHLYFIVLISLIYLFFPLLRKIKYSKFLFWLFFFFAILMHVISVTYEGYPVMGNMHLVSYGFKYSKYSLEPYEMFFVSLFFFLYGLWSARRQRPPGYEWLMQKIKISLQIPLLVLFVLVAYAATLTDYYYKVESGIASDPSGRIWRIVVIFYAISVIFLMQKVLTEKKSEIIGALSRASFLVYLIHPAILEAFRAWKVPWLIPSVIIVSWFIGVLLTLISRRYSWAGIFFGDADRVLRKYLVK